MYKFISNVINSNLDPKFFSALESILGDPQVKDKQYVLIGSSHNDAPIEFLTHSRRFFKLLADKNRHMYLMEKDILETHFFIHEDGTFPTLTEAQTNAKTLYDNGHVGWTKDILLRMLFLDSFIKSMKNGMVFLPCDTRDRKKFFSSQSLNQRLRKTLIDTDRYLPVILSLMKQTHKEIFGYAKRSETELKIYVYEYLQAQKCIKADASTANYVRSITNGRQSVIYLGNAHLSSEMMQNLGGIESCAGIHLFNKKKEALNHLAVASFLGHPPAFFYVKEEGRVYPPEQHLFSEYRAFGEAWREVVNIAPSPDLLYPVLPAERIEAAKNYTISALEHLARR